MTIDNIIYVNLLRGAIFCGLSARLIVLLIVVIGLVQPNLVAFAQDVPSAGQLYNEGLEARRAGRLDDAIERLGRAAEIEPENGDVQVQLGLALSSRGRYDEARRAFAKALERTPDYADAHLGLARTFYFENRLDEAERELNTLLERSPQNIEAKELKERVAKARDGASASRPAPSEPAPAERLARKAEAEPLYREGVEARRSGRLVRALEALSGAVRRQPENADAQVQLGLTLIGLRRYDQARSALTKAVAIAPDYADARLGLARLAFFRQDLAEAERELKTILDRAPRNVEAEALRAQVAKARRAARRPGRAQPLEREPTPVARYERRSERPPATPRATEDDERRKLGRARLLRKALRFSEAEALYRDVLKRRPRDVDVLVAAGLVTAFQGQARFADARRDFERALALAPSSLDATLGLARLDLYAGDLSSAEERVAQLLAKQPGNVEARTLNARIILARGDAERAEAAFREISTQEPRDADILTGLGDALRAQLRDEEALTAYRTAAAIDPASAEIRQRLNLRSRPRWRLDVDGAYSDLTDGQKPWREASLRLARQLTARTTLTGGLEASERFGKRDMLIDARADHRWTEAFTSYLRLGGTPAADFRPRFLTELGGSARLTPGWGVIGATVATFDIGFARYPTAEVRTANPGLQQYFFDGRFWLTAKLIGTLSRDMDQERLRQPGESPGQKDGTKRMGGFYLRADLQVAERLRLFVGHADAPDASDGRVFETRSFFGGAELALDDRISLRLSLARENRKNSYDRTTINVGTTMRF